MNFKLQFLPLIALTLACAACDTPSTTLTPVSTFTLTAVPRPEIPARRVSIADYGAVADGVTLATDAFAAAIDDLASQGGGHVDVPAGVWYTGPIVLQDHIDLHLDRNAVIIFSDDKQLYPLVQTVFEGLDTWRCQSPLSARGVSHISITGAGVIDGNGDAWRAVKQDKLTPRDWAKKIRSGVLSEDGKTWYPSESYKFGATSGADQNVSTWAKTREDFESMHDFLRPVMVAIHDCDHVLLEGVTFQNSPCWNIHPAMCTNLIVNDIAVRCPDYAQNSDGLDVESCNHVEITNSRFDVGDDGICIKSGKDQAGRDRGIPCENILVDNCIVFHGHGGFVVGSEMSGGVNHVRVTNCTFSGTDVGLRFKSTRGRGGVVEHIDISDIVMNNILQDALLFDLFYGGKSASEAAADKNGEVSTDLEALPVDETTPAFRDIRIRNVWCRGARRAMYFNGLPEMNVERVEVENAAIYARNGASINESTDVRLKNVSIYAEKGPALQLNNVKRFSAEAFTAGGKSKTLFTVTGSRNEDITVHSAEITPECSILATSSENAVTIL